MDFNNIITTTKNFQQETYATYSTNIEFPFMDIIYSNIQNNNNRSNLMITNSTSSSLSSLSSSSAASSTLENFKQNYIINNDTFDTKDSNDTNVTSHDTFLLATSTSTSITKHIDNYFSDIFSWQGLCLVTVFCIFIVITIIGNTLVILAVITTRRLRTVTNCFVMSLAVADLLVGMFVMPPAVAVHLIGSWQLGWVLCDIWISLDVLVCTASILSLCAISVDRYLAVTQPLTYSRKRRSKRLALIMILIVWSLALAITCPPILGWYEPGRRDLTECRYNQNEGYVIFSAMGSFFIPMIVMIYVYARISCVIASRHDNMTDLNIHNKKNKKFHTVDQEAENDQDTSEQDVSPNQKKQIAARTLSNQTIGGSGGGGGKEHNDIIILEENGIARQTIGNSKNGSYELINASRTPSFKRQPSTLSVPKTQGAATLSNNSLSSPTTNLSSSQQSTEHWSYGHQRHSVRMQHHVNTTCVGGGNDTYVTRNTRVHHQKSLSNRISSLKKENKTTQTLSIVVGGFIACWLPFFIYYLITPFLTKAQVSPPLSEFLTWLGWFNSAINPFIYAFYSVDFRAAFWRLTFKRFFRNSTKGQYPSNTMSIRR